MNSRILGHLALIACVVGFGACGGSTSGDSREGTGGTGSTGTGGVSTTGGAPITGGTPTGGASTTGGAYTTTGGATVVPREPEQHREQATSCVGVHNPPEPTIYDPENSQCVKHADCTEGENGKCVVGIGMAGGMGFCSYDMCQTDSDCDPGMICYCSLSSAARCLRTGNCQVDATCGENNYCSPSMGSDCGGLHSVDGYHCHTPNDTCVDDSDCTGREYCDFNEYKNLWECTTPDDGCVIG